MNFNRCWFGKEPGKYIDYIYQGPVILVLLVGSCMKTQLFTFPSFILCSNSPSPMNFLYDIHSNMPYAGKIQLYEALI